MSYKNAQFWLIKASFVVTATAFVFFCVAPAVGYPLEWPQAMRLLEIVLPTFLAYLGSATQFITKQNILPQDELHGNNSLLDLLIRGPVIVFAVAAFAAIFAFGWTNSRFALPGRGMSIDVLAGIFAAALGLLTVTTSVLVGRLFGAQSLPEHDVSIKKGSAGARSRTI